VQYTGNRLTNTSHEIAARHRLLRLRYDLLWRGYSSALDRRATLRTFTDQIDELLKKLGLDGPIHFVGLALGSV
jgi:pimeloyl-ACP methyl ester carboxylesterase